MTTFSFKSSGKTQEQIVAQQIIQSQTPIGIKTPLRLGTEHIFDVNYSLIDQIHDNLRNLLLTNWGERLGLYDYGANLRPLTTELVSQDDFDAQCISRISGAVQKWMSYVTLETFESVIDHFNNKNTAIIKLIIVYSVPNLNITQKTLEIIMYVI